MNHSLRRRLLLLLLPLSIVVWLLSAYSSYRATQHEVEELFDAQMAQSARTLMALAGHEVVEIAAEGRDAEHLHRLDQTLMSADGHKYEYKLSYQFWAMPQQQLLMRSFNAPHVPLGNQQAGYSTRQLDGRPWRVYVLSDVESGLQIQVGEALAIRDELTARVAMSTALPLLLGLPLLALVISVAVSRSLRPLRHLAEAIHRRHPDNLSPLLPANTPLEVAPLLGALNHLLQRLGRALENERRFTADAAHELRTPLAALRVQAQVALRSRQDAERKLALEQVVAGVDRAARLVEQLLVLARLDPAEGHALAESFELEPLAAEVIASQAGQAAASGIELELVSTRKPRLTAIRDSVELLLRNLLENAIRHTPREGRVMVVIERDERAAIILRVADSGSGIPQQERERVFERFYRLSGNEGPGSGLGLSIVRRVAELNHAEVTLGESSLGGLEVAVSFPA